MLLSTYWGAFVVQLLLSLISTPLAYQMSYSSEDSSNPLIGEEIDSRELSNINLVRAEKVPRIAFVEPTFTYAAYQNNSFYNFYTKYNPITPVGASVTADLQLIKNVTIPHGPIILHNDKPGTKPGIPYYLYAENLKERIRHVFPAISIINLRDEDIDGGKIFAPNGTNLFDVLFLTHEEYATARTYFNFKTFVNNGGTIVFTDSNILYAEISYDNKTGTISLVKGHRWEFDGDSARKSVNERWANESREWIGSNFLLAWKELHFKDNPFNYKKTEEVNITNSRATILHDFMVFDPNDSLFKGKVASYEMTYGKGKVIHTGIFGHTLYDNPVFMNFFEYVIVPHSLGSAYSLNINGTLNQVNWILNSGRVSKISTLADDGSLSINLDRTFRNDDSLIISVPKQALGLGNISKGSYLSLNVTVDGAQSHFNYSNIQREVGLSIRIGHGSSNVRIQAELFPLPFALIAGPSINVEAKGKSMHLGIETPTIRGKIPGPFSITSDQPPDFKLGTTSVRWSVKTIGGLEDYDFQNITLYDNIKPTIEITYPTVSISNSITVSHDNSIIVKGTSSDLQSGIKMVDVRIISVKDKENSAYRLASPKNPGDWSSWSIPLKISSTDLPLTIYARATDHAGNENLSLICMAEDQEPTPILFWTC
jgi:hypothetical protein